jgi:hypothetical protein
VTLTLFTYIVKGACVKSVYPPAQSTVPNESQPVSQSLILSLLTPCISRITSCPDSQLEFGWSLRILVSAAVGIGSVEGSDNSAVNRPSQGGRGPVNNVCMELGLR